MSSYVSFCADTLSFKPEVTDHQVQEAMRQFLQYVDQGEDTLMSDEMHVLDCSDAGLAYFDPEERRLHMAMNGEVSHSFSGIVDSTFEALSPLLSAPFAYTYSSSETEADPFSDRVFYFYPEGLEEAGSALELSDRLGRALTSSVLPHLKPLVDQDVRAVRLEGASGAAQLDLSVLSAEKRLLAQRLLAAVELLVRRGD